MSIEETLTARGIELPATPAPVSSYVPVRVHAGFAYVAGQIAWHDGEVMHAGHLGDDVTLEQGRECARRGALQALSILRDALGSLDRVAAIMQVSVFVASAPGFADQPKVANGASDLLVEVFGEAGKHARTAVGVAELPLGASVEVALVAAVAGD